MHRSGRVVVLAVLVVVSGCSGLPSDGFGPDDPGTTVLDESARVTVTTVIDGDTIEVRYANGSTETVRLLGVDTPETHAENQPTEFEGVPDTTAGRSCLRRAGENATRYLTGRVLGESVRIQFDPVADRRGYYGRLLAYVHHDDENVNYRLVAAGHARVYDARFSNEDRFYAAEERAQGNATGVWACADEPARLVTDGGTEPLAVATVHADAAGPDGDNLADEYVVLENTGEDPLDLTGWTVSDAAGHSYTFAGNTSLAPGATLTLRTGQGTDTEGERYWGLARPIWNNDGDTVTVRDDDGTVVARRTYDG